MRWFAALAACAMAASCVQLLPDTPEAPRLYPLEPAGFAANAPGEEAQTIAVAVPTGISFLLSDTIAWRQDGVMGAMSGAAWPDQAGELLQRIFVQALAQSLPSDNVVRRGGSVRADYELQLDVSRFEIEETASALDAVFEARALVVDARTRGIVQTETLDVRIPVERRSASVAAEALQRSAREGAALLASRMAARRTP